MEAFSSLGLVPEFVGSLISIRRRWCLVMVPCTPVLRGLSQRGPSIEAWGPCVAVAHLSGCQLDKHPYVWAHLRRRPHIQPLPILCVVTASRFLSSRYCAFLGRVLLRRFFPFLLQRVRWGAQFPDGTEALPSQSPCRIIVKGSYLGRPARPVSPVLAQISHPAVHATRLRAVGRLGHLTDPCSKEQYPNLP